jgi:hypothetical protein
MFVRYPPAGVVIGQDSRSPSAPPDRLTPNLAGPCEAVNDGCGRVGLGNPTGVRGRIFIVLDHGPACAHQRRKSVLAQYRRSVAVKEYDIIGQHSQRCRHVSTDESGGELGGAGFWGSGGHRPIFPRVSLQVFCKSSLWTFGRRISRATCFPNINTARR